MKTRVFYYRLSALLLFALLLAYQLYKVFHTGIWIDAAIFATVGKNILLGNGYSVVDYDHIIPFHPGITAGPVIILPALGMIALFGNTYWAPGLALVCLIAALLILTFIQLRKMPRMNTESCWQIVLFFLISAPLVINGDIGFKEQHMMPWHSLLGEIPSALFTLIAVCFITARPQTPKNMFYAGLLAGLSGLCKLQALIGSGALGLYLLIHEAGKIKQGMPRPALRKSICGLFFYGVGMFLPVILFEWVKIVLLGSLENYLQRIKLLMGYIQMVNNNSGLEYIFARIGVLGTYLGVMPAQYSLSGMCLSIIVFASLLTAAIYFIGYAYRTSDLSSFKAAAGALLFCNAVYLVWWTVICSFTGMRYCIPGLLYLCAGIALLIGDISLHNPRKGSVVLGLVVLMVLFIKLDSVKYLADSVKMDPHLQETLKVKDKLLALQKAEPDTLIFSCSNAFEMEYLLPHSANFLRCDNMFDPSYQNHKHVLLTYFADASGKVLTYYPNSILSYKRDNPSNVRASCPKDDIYAGERYFIASCRTP